MSLVERKFESQVIQIPEHACLQDTWILYHSNQVDLVVFALSVG